MIEVKNLFVTEERQVLNDTVKQGMTKEELLKDIAFQYEINDPEFRNMLKDLSNKIKTLNNDEFAYLISIVPIEVAYSAEINVDELPEEEYD